MSKFKKYFIFGASGLLLATGVVAVVFALINLLNPTTVDELAASLLNLGWIDGAEQNKLFARILISLVMSSGVISLGFAGFGIRFGLYSSQEYFIKQSILLTMAIMFIILPMPILVVVAIIDFTGLTLASAILSVMAGGVFLASTLIKDSNYVPQEEADSEVDMLEVKLRKLKDLKDKDLITDEEYEKLRKDILN